jgi:hypothetical protein
LRKSRYLCLDRTAPALNRPSEIRGQRLLGGLRGGRQLVLERRVFPDPKRDAAQRVLLLRRFRSMHNGGVGDLDIGTQVGTEIEPLMAFLGRGARVAVEQHDIRNIFRIDDDMAHETVTVPRCAWRLGHCEPPLNFRRKDGWSGARKKAARFLKFSSSAC